MQNSRACRGFGTELSAVALQSYKAIFRGSALLYLATYLSPSYVGGRYRCVETISSSSPKNKGGALSSSPLTN